eukprot:1393170-Amphidinium_carterae.1
MSHPFYSGHYSYLRDPPNLFTNGLHLREVFDNNGYFEEARYKYYQRARDKAEATYSLNSVTRPLYVRWVCGHAPGRTPVLL